MEATRDNVHGLDFGGGNIFIAGPGGLLLVERGAPGGGPALREAGTENAPGGDACGGIATGPWGGDCGGDTLTAVYAP